MLQNVGLYFEPQGLLSNWHLDRIEVASSETHSTVVFPWNQWLKGKATITLSSGDNASQQMENATALVEYEV
jgi:hypothetical protein